jgi:hypothetical protein
MYMQPWLSIIGFVLTVLWMEEHATKIYDESRNPKPQTSQMKKKFPSLHTSIDEEEMP